MLRVSNNKWVIFIPDIFLRFRNEGMKVVWGVCAHIWSSGGCSWPTATAGESPDCILSPVLVTGYFSLGSNS